ncbi:MAG: hypothetical protein GC161_05130 [Planctomycetaceae bacterium]|nr:hypothetical protein [Planctomycetaceae bacterium]
MEPTEAVPIEELLQHRRWLCALARGLVADPEVAREVEQETWLVALRHPPKDRRNLRGWLSRVAARQARSRWRRRTWAGPLESDVPTDLDPAEMAAQVEVARVLAGHVLALDEPYRTTVLLRFWHGLDSPAIARREGIAAGTVRWRLKVALDQLRAILAEQRGPKTWATFLAPLVRQPAPASFGSLVALLWLPLLLPTAAAVALVAAAVTLLAPTPNEPEPHRVAALPSTPEFIETPPVHEVLAGSTEPITATTTTESTAQRTEVVPPATDSATGPVAVVRGRLVSNDGHPVVGAQVRATRDRSNSRRGWTSWTEVPVDGHFSIDISALKPDTGYPAVAQSAGVIGVEFRAPSFRTRKITSNASVSGVNEIGVVELVRGGRVEGVVLTSEGAPLPRAQVAASAATGLNMTQLEREMERRPYSSDHAAYEGLSFFTSFLAPSPIVGTTDAQGRFHLDGVPEGATVVLATGRCRVHAASTPIEVVRGMVASVPPFVLKPAPPSMSVAGIVLASDGTPVGNAWVRIRGASETTPLHQMLVTDDDGRFSQCGLVDAPWTLQAETMTRGVSLPVRVEAGTQDVELRLRAWPSLRLRVTSYTGEALDQVSVRRVTPHSSSTLFYKVIDDRIEVHLPPEPATLIVGAREHRDADLGKIDPRKPHNVIDVVLERPGAVPKCTGRVVDAEGMPVQGALVGLLHAEDVPGLSNGFPARSYPALSLLMAVQTSHPDGPDSMVPYLGNVALTDEHGSWSFTVEDPDAYYVQIRAPGWSLRELGPVALNPAELHDFGEIRLTRGGGLKGRVFNEFGSPSAHVVVAISRGDGWPTSTRTDAEGRYAFENLTPGKWFARTQKEEIVSIGSEFWGGGNRPTELVFNTSVADGETTVFDLGEVRTAELALEVTLTIDGDPAAGWEAHLLLEDQDMPLEAQLDKKGSVRWRWAKDSSKTASVSMQSPSGLRIMREVQLDELSGPFVLDIQTGELVLHGVPREVEDGAATVAYCKFDGWIAVALVTSEDGTWRARVPAGDWRVVRGDEDTDVEDPDELPALNSGTLVPGGVLELHLP